ncbi:hypothetical protein OG439_46290 [Amycolatopsis sp. NBC_01307]|uniref:hypothetical protein n=1 Tax=Amycolatopsis sp. NBC_01307 TaxID=2903561 RepID=UPI002E1630D5|nr:hypothetical protein OG439_46290 [Amycolatopsis sp. NBC_01307]
MPESRTSLSDLIGHTSANLKIVAARFKVGVVSADELKECSGMLTALADALNLHADKTPGSESSGRHALKEPPP